MESTKLFQNSETGTSDKMVDARGPSRDASSTTGHQNLVANIIGMVQNKWMSEKQPFQYNIRQQ
jgi:hypothetical protein